MNDKHIENLIKKSWAPEEPEGMRERVLRRSREEYARVHADRRPRLRWKPLLAAVGIAFVLAGNLCDRATQGRLTAMTGGSEIRMDNDDLIRWRRDMRDMLAFSSQDGCLPNHLGGNDRL